MLLLMKRSLLLAAMTCANFGYIHAASAAAEERLSRPEVLKLNECMAMTSDALSQDGQCQSVMKKASLTASDMEKMRRCESMLKDAESDPDCAAMIKKHPDLVRGHGRSMPADPPPNESKPTP